MTIAGFYQFLLLFSSPKAGYTFYIRCIGGLNINHSIAKRYGLLCCTFQLSQCCEHGLWRWFTGFRIMVTNDMGYRNVEVLDDVLDISSRRSADNSSRNMVLGYYVKNLLNTIIQMTFANLGISQWPIPFCPCLF